MLSSEYFLLADILDKEKFNVEVIVQCIRISKMPQTHHHALLLLGAVAGMFPVSSIWNVCVGSSLQVPNIVKIEERTELSVRRNFLKGTRGKIYRFPALLGLSIPFSLKTNFCLDALVTSHLWLAMKCIGNQRTFLTTAVPHLPAVVKVLMYCFFFPLLFYIHERKHLAQ